MDCSRGHAIIPVQNQTSHVILNTALQSPILLVVHRVRAQYFLCKYLDLLRSVSVLQESAGDVCTDSSRPSSKCLNGGMQRSVWCEMKDVKQAHVLGSGPPCSKSGHKAEWESCNGRLWLCAFPWRVR